MPAYFLSDVHLRLDRPERGRRLARLVDTLGPNDPLTIVGDLCDFWFASRQRREDPMSCQGLRSLAGYRERGGALTILAGNHDTWLGPFYEQTLGATFVPDALEVSSGGFRIHLVHGHRLGARSPWKAVMEGRAFLSAFSSCPGPLARRLERLLDRTNDHIRSASERRHLDLYRRHADAMAGSVDIAAYGHTHRALDDGTRAPRLIVLGGWHFRASYLVVDGGEARFLIIEDEPAS